MEKRAAPACFADIERELGIPPPSDERDEYPLPRWYRSVRDVPLVQLTVADVAKACRQQLYPEYVVALALAMLLESPLAGEMYDGELLVSLKSVPSPHWTEHSDDRQVLTSILDQVLSQLDDLDDLKKDALDLRSRLGA